jgi:hypothetical protein
LIQIDSGIMVTCPTSFQYNSDQLAVTTAECNYSTTPATFTFKSPFKQEYEYIEGDHYVLRIVFNEAKMPRS